MSLIKKFTPLIIFICVSLIITQFDTLPFNQRNITNSTDVDLYFLNKTCEKCKIISVHKVGCFCESVSQTCKVYFESCEQVPCVPPVPILADTSNDCIIIFHGQTIRIPGMYILVLILSIFYLLLQRGTENNIVIDEDGGTDEEDFTKI